MALQHHRHLNSFFISVTSPHLTWKSFLERKLLSALQTAKLLTKHVFHLHGIPQDILSDRGPQFISQIGAHTYLGLSMLSTHTSLLLLDVHLLKHLLGIIHLCFLLTRRISQFHQFSNMSAAAELSGTQPFKPFTELLTRTSVSLTGNANLHPSISLDKEYGYRHETCH
ncbi:hypothetical protein AMECASPLE_006732 [Ameca splendens]|uniref:Integrase catalytic domain-containing protein n=1 Tax=Ameca splendens TaxID=208324 RepID=A0ABV0XZE7_9TELE